MKTSALIAALARDAGAVPRGVVLRRVLLAALLGAAVSVVWALAWWGAIPNALYAQAGPWMKLAYAGVLSAAALTLARQLACPLNVTRGPRSVRSMALLALVTVGVVLVVGLWWWSGTPEPQRAMAVEGKSWLKCPPRILMLGLPTLAALFFVVRGFAPTRPLAAGLACGLAAGAVGAAAYALTCGETSPTFIALWYTVGIALVALLGAALGPRLLRW
jgi:hypothetical protein